MEKIYGKKENKKPEGWATGKRDGAERASAIREGAPEIRRRQREGIVGSVESYPTAHNSLTRLH